MASKIDAKIDTEKVSENDAKRVPKEGQRGPKGSPGEPKGTSKGPLEPPRVSPGHPKGALGCTRGEPFGALRDPKELQGN